MSTYSRRFGEEHRARTDPLQLLFKPFGRVYETPTITKPEFLQAMGEIYQSVYGITHPDKHETFVKLAASLDGVGIWSRKA